MNLKIVHTKDGRTLYKDLDTGHWIKKDQAEAAKQYELISQQDHGVGIKALMNSKGLGLPQAKKLWDSMSEEEKRNLITTTKEHEGSILLNSPIAKKIAFEKSLREVSDIRDTEKDDQIKKREAEAKLLNQPKPETIENKYGFEVENKDDPILSFTDSHWKKMAELKKHGKFYDHDLYDAVRDKITEIVDKYEDLYNYDSDACILRERMDEYGITDSEWWAGWHLLAEWLGLKGKEK